jgi:DNA-binding LacI/PurR family transcriptional regulator
MDRLFDSHLPVVAIANAHPAIPSVVIDDVTGSTLIAKYLAQKGHRRILYRSHGGNRDSAVRRREAFLAVASNLGMAVIDTHEERAHGVSDEEVALLLGPPEQRPTAAVCWMDLNAYALLDRCAQLGIRVPDDLAIVGFDGVPLRIKPERMLTTVRAPWVEVADQAVTNLLALLDGNEVSPETNLPVEFVVGDTT